MSTSQHDLQGALYMGVCERPQTTGGRRGAHSYLPAPQNIAEHLQGLMKGYISREHAMVVLNKKGAFPGTGV